MYAAIPWEKAWLKTVTERLAWRLMDCLLCWKGIEGVGMEMLPERMHLALAVPSDRS